MIQRPYYGLIWDKAPRDTQTLVNNAYIQLNTNVPFGKLLSNNHVKISIKDRTYFSVKCDKLVASLTHCHLNSKLYGRTNTIIKADNNKWLAHVVEILPGVLK